MGTTFRAAIRRGSCLALAAFAVLGAGGCRKKYKGAEMENPGPQTSSIALAEADPVGRTTSRGNQPLRLDNRDKRVAEKKRERDHHQMRIEVANDMYFEGVELLNRGNPERARDTFVNAIKINANEPAFWGKLGDALASLGDDQAAVESWEKTESLLLSAKPSSATDEQRIQNDLAQTCYSRARIRLRNDDLAGGEADLRRSLDYYRDYPPALLELGRLNLEASKPGASQDWYRQRLAAADDWYRRALRAAPDLLDAQLGLAIVDYRRGNIPEAWKRLAFIQEQGFAVNPDLWRQVDDAYNRLPRAQRG